MKSIKPILAACLAIGLVTGCSSTSSETESSTTTTTNETETSSTTTQDTEEETSTVSDATEQTQSTEGESTITGKVTAIDGETITVAVMGGDRGGAQGGQPDASGEQGEAPAGDDGDVDSSEHPDANTESSDMPAETPAEGSMDAEGGNMSEQGDFQGESEEKTITVSDESVISVESDGSTTQGSLSDITVDSAITVTYITDEDGTETISQIAVSDMSSMEQGEASEAFDESSIAD